MIVCGLVVLFGGGFGMTVWFLGLIVVCVFGFARVCLVLMCMFV